MFRVCFDYNGWRSDILTIFGDALYLSYPVLTRNVDIR